MRCGGLGWAVVRTPAPSGGRIPAWTAPYASPCSSSPSTRTTRRSATPSPRAEDAGVDIVFNWDHFFPLDGEPDGKHFECWTMLGAWAEATSRVEIGALVTCNSYRNPDLLADMARTVDHISGGRLDPRHRRGLVRAGLPRVRLRLRHAGHPAGRPGQALPRITSRWARLNPPPTRPIPVLIGGGGERKTLRYTAEHADIWHAFGSLETIRHKSGVLDGHCADVGRDPAEIERSTAVRRPPEDVAEGLVDAGVTLFTIGSHGPDYDLDLARRWVAWRDAR